MGWGGSGVPEFQGQNLVLNGADPETPFYQFPRGDQALGNSFTLTKLKGHQ